MIPASHGFWIGLAFTWGAVWGSFLNVVIYRLPAGLSVVRPGSRCGSCETPIRWLHNIPILSWIMLRGRCGACQAPFSIRYPLIEAAVAMLSVAIWLKLTHPPHNAPVASLPDLLMAWFFLFVFVADLVAIAMIDLDTMRIPDVLSLPGIALGLACAVLAGHVTGVPIHESLLGTLLGGGTLLVVTYGYFALTGREGMGLGDYRLMAMVGATLGWRSLLFLLIASATQGIAFALLARWTGLDAQLPTLDPEEGELETGVLASTGDNDDERSSPENDLSPAPAEHGTASGTETFRHMAIPFGPFIVLSALEWLVFEPWLMQLFERFLLGS